MGIQEIINKNTGKVSILDMLLIFIRLYDLDLKLYVSFS